MSLGHKTLMITLVIVMDFCVFGIIAASNSLPDDYMDMDDGVLASSLLGVEIGMDEDELEISDPDLGEAEYCLGPMDCPKGSCCVIKDGSKSRTGYCGPTQRLGEPCRPWQQSPYAPDTYLNECPCDDGLICAVPEKWEWMYEPIVRYAYGNVKELFLRIKPNFPRPPPICRVRDSGHKKRHPRKFTPSSFIKKFFFR